MEVAPTRKLRFHGTRKWACSDAEKQSHSATLLRRRCILTIGPKDAESCLPSCMCAVSSQQVLIATAYREFND